MFEKISLRIPKFAIPLHTSFFKGCRIHDESERPHSFEIILDKNSTFYFGAADETEMMDWIQTLYASAAKVHKLNKSMNIFLLRVNNFEICLQVSHNVVDNDKESPVISCFITLTINQILLHQFPNKIITRAFLEDVTDFRVSKWPHNYFCVLVNFFRIILKSLLRRVLRQYLFFFCFLGIQLS